MQQVVSAYVRFLWSWLILLPFQWRKGAFERLYYFDQQVDGRAMHLCQDFQMRRNRNLESKSAKQ